MRNAAGGQGGAINHLARPTRLACAATKRGTRNFVVAYTRPLRSGGVVPIEGAVGKPARWHSSDRRAWRAPLRRRGLSVELGIALLVAAAAKAVGKPARWHSSNRRAWRAPLRRGRLRTPAVFVAAASSPSKGPSVSRHVGVHPTDALGARRYEEGTPRAFLVE